MGTLRRILARLFGSEPKVPPQPVSSVTPAPDDVRAGRFADIGMPFPLFEGQVSEAAEFAGQGSCTVCSKDDWVFRLDIGCYLVLACDACGAENGLHVSDRQAQDCHDCGRRVEWPGIPETEEVLVCFSCLRDGKAAITSDTELGMVSFEQAVEGLTHGLPGLATADYELVETDSDWVRARLDSDIMFELLRTPNFLTWQGERWMFCCGRPMVYTDRWLQKRFFDEAGDEGAEALYDSLVDMPYPPPWDWDQPAAEDFGVYMFRCDACGKRRGYWDIH